MDYQYYYNEARNRYNNACYEYNQCTNTINALEVEVSNKKSLIAFLNSEIKKNKSALKGVNTMLGQEDSTERMFSNVKDKVKEASDNYGKMASHDGVSSKDWTEVFADETSQTGTMIKNTFSDLENAKKIIEQAIEDLEKQKKTAQDELESLKEDIKSEKSDRSHWNGVKRNAAGDMDYYKRKMEEEDD